MRYHRLWLALAVLPLAFAGGDGQADAQEGVTPIQFPRGATGVEVRGAVVRGERALYSIEAREGQRMTLRITAPEDNAVFQLYAPGARPERRDSTVEVAGEALPGAREGDDARGWSARLPQSGAYLVVVGSSRGNATYRLSVTIR